MEPETDNIVDVDCEQIGSSELESIAWYSASQIQRLLDLNKPALQRAISKLTSIYSLDIKILRRGGARATEYSQTAVDAIKLLNAQKFAELRKLVDKMPAVPFFSTQVGIVAPLKFKENANNQLAISNSQIVGLQQEAQFKLQELQQLYGQWQDAEEAEKSAQQKDLEAQEAQWELECIDEVMREEMFKKTRKREIKQMLKNSTGAV